MKRTRAGNAARRIGLCLVAAALSVLPAQAESYEIVHRFSASSYSLYSTGRLLAMPDGTFFGTTPSGGVFNKGSIYVLTPDGADHLDYSDVHSFSGFDGSQPQGDLVLGADGAIYGTTLAGGAGDDGTIFRFDRAGRLTRLHDFADGGGTSPSALLLAPNGSFYGTTASGGANGLGTVFQFDASETLTTLHSFGSAGEGTHPASGLILATDGNFWGMTPSGGALGFGTIFRIDSAGNLTTVHSFAGSNADGYSPSGPLVQSSDGFLYGTTTTTTVLHVFGTVFRMSLGGNLVTLHVFDTTSGGPPTTGLTQGPFGYLYGATTYYSDPEPPGGSPTVLYSPALYLLDPSGNFFKIHTFVFPEGPPTGGLIFATNGALYAPASQGVNSRGSILRVVNDGLVTTVTRMYDMPMETLSLSPIGPLTEASDGSLYMSNRSILRLDPTGHLSLFHIESDVEGSTATGIIEASDGQFYASLTFGSIGYGRFCTLDGTGGLTVLHEFAVSEPGGNPGRPIQASDGDFYVTGSESVLRFDASGTPTILHTFSGADGFDPFATLIEASDGNFYATTRKGGANDLGTVYRVDSAGNLNTLHEFAGTDGSLPASPLLEGSDGFLYGTTPEGGAHGFGTIFRIGTSGGLTTLHDAETVPTQDGLVERSDGNFYGADSTRVFKMDPSGTVTTVHEFTSPEGFVPTTLLRGSEDSLYGVVRGPGVSPGVLFRISDVASAPSITALDPVSGRAAGGASAIVSGHHFREGVSVTFGGQSASVYLSREGLLTTVAPALPAGALYDVTVTNSDATTATLPGTWFADFADVPGTNLFHDAIETVFRNGITAGCGGGAYCPTAPVTRAQMAVFLLKAEHGPTHVPPNCTGHFDDVPCPSIFADWIEELAAEGVTAGCGDGSIYCPADAVTRQQMAVFLLKAEHGSAYAPPSCTAPGSFPDAPCPGPFTDWIEQLAAEGITGGCGGGNFCPGNPNTRGQMAVFLTKTFGLE